MEPRPESAHSAATGDATGARRPGGPGSAPWRPIPLAALLDRSQPHHRVARLVWLWLAVIAGSVATSVVMVVLDWNGLPVQAGPFTFHLTVYPPLVLCTWALFWLGFPWAFLAAYVATLVGALVAGMPAPWALLFAFADPLGLAVYALAYRVAPLSVHMRSLSAAFWFLATSVVGALAGSTGSFIWTHSQQMGVTETFAVWQGWWMGAFLQAACINLPVLAILGPRVEAWRQRSLPEGRRPEVSRNWTIATVLVFFAVVGAFVSANGSLIVARLSTLDHGALPAELGTAMVVAVWSLGLLTWHTLALLGVAAVGVLLLAMGWTRTLRAEVASRTAELQESQERYALAARGANDGLWDWDVAGGRVYYSPRWKAMLGHGDQEVGETIEEWLDRIHPDDRAPAQAALEAHLAGHTSHFENEHRMRHREGDYRWMLSRGVCVRDGAGQALRMAGSQTDVTERRAAEQQLLHDAFHDHLTGLPNRALFLDRVGSVIGRAQRNPGHDFAVLFFDLDRFKVINDGLGHAVGDQVLVAVADRLSRCVRPGDTVARLGGDEFAVLLDGISGRDAATDFAERINTHLIRPFHIAGNEVFTSASIGIASSRTGYSRAEDMLRDADTAMYRAKHLGKARHQVFDTAMHARAMRQLLLENDLRRAMERAELSLLYQPIVALPSRQVRGFEALLRWHHPDWGEVPRQEFLPVAEETGLILPLGDWVLEQACRQLSLWRTAAPGARGLTISVNLSGRQIAQGDLIDRVTAALAAAALPVSSLRLEITESVLMEHLEPATAALQRLKELGVAVDIDDFGTGYSSLSYLHRFPIDRVKIDRSFVGSMLDDPQSLEIVRAIVGLAQSLGMEAVAEGVEHEPEAAMLTDLGCPMAQGYLLGMPLPPDDVADRL